MTHGAWRAFGVAWSAICTVLVTACGHNHASQLDHSLDRVQDLLVILEGIGSDADAEVASRRIADWEAGWGLHGDRTAGLESVSGTSYTSLLESRKSRSSELRMRLRRQINRLTVDEYLDRYEKHMNSALTILPPEIRE